MVLTVIEEWLIHCEEPEQNSLMFSHTRGLAMSPPEKLDEDVFRPSTCRMMGFSFARTVLSLHHLLAPR